MLSNPSSSCVICGRPFEPRLGIRTRTCDDAACRLTYKHHLRCGAATCHSCGRPLSPQLAARGARTCGDLECGLLDRRNESLPPEHRCRFCRVPLLAAVRNAAAVCDDRDCLAVLSAANAADRANQVRVRFHRQTAQGTMRRGEQAVRDGVPDPEAWFVTVVPWFRSPLTPLPESRREALRSHVRRLVEDMPPRRPQDGESAGATQLEDAGPCCPLDPLDRDGSDLPVVRPEGPWPDVGPAGERLTAAVCGHCRGFCCQQGGTHAFLSVDTIESFLQRRPDILPEQVVDEYLNQLPEQSYNGSCVFHSRTGCALPHDMRAATCGLYYCWGQQELRAALEKGAPRRAFVAVAQDEQIVDGRFLDGSAGDYATVKS